MSYRIHPKQIEKITALDGEDRYAHFIGRVADWKEVWGLRSSEGWVSAAHESGVPAFVVWPHPEYAALHAQGAWADGVPEAIDLELFLAEWLPKMQAESVPIAVFPVQNSKAIFVSAAKLASDLEAELSQYE